MHTQNAFYLTGLVKANRHVDNDLYMGHVHYPYPYRSIFRQRNDISAYTIQH